MYANLIILLPLLFPDYNEDETCLRNMYYIDDNIICYMLKLIIENKNDNFLLNLFHLAISGSMTNLIDWHVRFTRELK